ncbi:hypothetical protein KCTC32516_02268 [Polaribacter huanghezhanensis]|uniref:hypothetical protein n=1 Tax=Polaribacter huanghezhanensis TaxID=1354726 RepID=UPI00264748A6|nr:hypothetical protein [Polaribacter huanghezhanensis]WKD86888.1 hypothetical protein KCTC32516_02268 [Polaribacter huanghezhanensis]
MNIKKIITDRHYQTWPSWHIIYEWENEISKSLNLPLKNSPGINKYIFFLVKNLKRVNKKLFKGRFDSFLNEILVLNAKNSFYFEMHPKGHKQFSNFRKTIPIIVDFFSKSKIEFYKEMYADCPYLLITSLEVLNFLEENHIKTKLIHFPISLPSMYKLLPNQFIEKKYDIVLAGRTNVVLWDYLKRYEKSHPEVEYLYQIEQNGELYYKSNLNGIIGNFHTRQEYINLIKLARISFYSTPGIDGGEKRTNGFNPVTPRFLELLSAGCHIIGRYPKNSETDYYKLETICPSTNSYSDFKNQLNIVLNLDPPIKRNSEYLENHYTSTRIEILKKINE